jgi:hypothetical protein
MPSPFGKPYPVQVSCNLALLSFSAKEEYKLEIFLDGL